MGDVAKRLFWGGVISIVLFACNNNEKIVSDVSLEMYYQDSIDLKKYIVGDNATFSNEQKLFSLEKGMLYIKNYSKIDRVYYTFSIGSVNFSVKLKSWIDNKYSVEEVDYNNKRVILTKRDTTFYFVDDRLFYSVGDMSSQIDCGKLLTPDLLYNQMVAENGVYAVRLGANIFVSRDLKTWTHVFNRKRGITDIMALVKNRESSEMELVFGDYTSGTERVRHYIYKYGFKSNKLRTTLTFYTQQENDESQVVPFARHIHVLMKDPYTGDLYLGTGDTDRESNIYRSTDDGETFQLLGGGSQVWRTLSFIFTENSVFWNTDSHEPQYLTRIFRNQIVANRILNNNELVRFPLINSALWSNQKIVTPDGKQMYIMNSSAEGALYDNWCRTYGIIIRNEIPVAYELFKIEGRCWATQLFLIGVDNENNIYLCDHEIGKFSRYKFQY